MRIASAVASLAIAFTSIHTPCAWSDAAVIQIDSEKNTFEVNLPKIGLKLDLPTGWQFDPEESEWNTDAEEDFSVFSFQTGNSRQEFDIFIERFKEPQGLEKYVFEELENFDEDEDEFTTTYTGLSFKKVQIVGIDMLRIRANITEEDQGANIEKYAGCTYMFVKGNCAYSFALVSFDEGPEILDEILDQILQSISFREQEIQEEQDIYLLSSQAS